ncbi:hypothetical protein MXB_1088 [Myxobolus squamalis]|nr:hypothetical protein MXB_1088 [Myxobolus squamalis]
MHGNYQRQRRGNTGAILLLIEIFNIGTQFIPPVTLFVTFVNLLMYMDIFNNLPGIDASCCSYHDIIQSKSYYRLFLCSITHADDWHLYYNMVSFIYKGTSLERRINGKRMSVMLILFCIISNILTIFTYHYLYLLLGIESYKYVCCVGNTYFCDRKVVISSMSDTGRLSLYGISLNGLLVILGELFFIWLVASGSSFIGHLSGIIVGILYVSGPLKLIENSISSLLNF